MTETPEERSKQTFDAWYQEDIQGSNQVPETLIATYAIAIREAEERGRLAGLAEAASVCDRWAEFQREEYEGHATDRLLQMISGRLDASEKLADMIRNRARSTASPTTEEKG